MITLKLTVNSIMDISRLCILFLTPSTSISQSVSPSQHNRAFLGLMGKMFFAILCQVPSDGNTVYMV